MKRNRTVVIAAILIFALMSAVGVAAEPPKVGSTLPALKLPRLDESKVSVLIIQVFSLYCPYCQKDAPNMNRFFSLIENNPKLKGKIKIIGIGAGNTQFEVNTFKKKYHVEFPLTADPDYSAHKILGEVRTPYFIVVKLNGSKKMEVVYSRLGGHENPEAFLDEVVRLSGIQ
ncbi:MAG TPA: redoxin family protein [Smithellaceae bacterium]|nr:redoxin family protein [Smithellaceae bacterium]